MEELLLIGNLNLKMLQLLQDYNDPIPKDGIQLLSDNDRTLGLANTGNQTAKSKHM